MLNFNGIDHVNINVSNLEESLSFYKKIFGFEVKEKGISQKSGNPYAIIGKSNLGFLALNQKSDFEELGELNHLGFNISNFNEAEKLIRDANIPLLYGGEVVEYENSKSLYIEAPDGLEIEISSNYGGGL